MAFTLTADTNQIPAGARQASPTTRNLLPRGRLWAGRITSGAAVLFLLFDSSLKLLRLLPAEQVTAQLGYPVSTVRGIGIVEILCLLLYVVPRTSVLGAILFTGYLGGAIATHVRVGSPLFSHTLFPIYVAALLWGGLLLRHKGLLRGLFPRRPHA
jgi:hypothetical protein